MIFAVHICRKAPVAKRSEVLRDLDPFIIQAQRKHLINSLLTSSMPPNLLSNFYSTNPSNLDFYITLSRNMRKENDRNTNQPPSLGGLS